MLICPPHVSASSHRQLHALTAPGNPAAPRNDDDEPKQARLRSHRPADNVRFLASARDRLPHPDMPPQIKQDLNRSGWETTDFPSVCERCLPENPYVQMLKEDYGAVSACLDVLVSSRARLTFLRRNARYAPVRSPYSDGKQIALPARSELTSV
jgi:hypothetical protein